MRRLAQALKTWIGPDYRQVSELFPNETVGCQIMFLRRKMYGDVSEDGSIYPHEKELAERLRHWKKLPLKIWPSNVPFYSSVVKKLSNPYGMGMRWYPTAARELLNIIVSCRRYEQINNLNLGRRPEYIQHAFCLSNFNSILWKWVRNRDKKDTAELKKLKREVRHSDHTFERL